MKTKSFSQMNLSKFFCVLSVVFITLIYSACNSSDTAATDSQNKVSPDWLTFQIKFKQKTDGEMRDLAIRGIEKLLYDSISLMRPTFSPNFRISKNLFEDSLTYFVSVGRRMLLPPSAGSTKNYAIMSAKDTISNPPCTCANLCKPCLMVTSVGSDTLSGSPFRSIESITPLE
jgi:hypothetical protein